MILFSRNKTMSNEQPLTRKHHIRTLFEGTFKLVRDRGLDHAVEREKNLKPLWNLKNLIKLEPSKSLPISVIRESLELPFRSIDFIRKYPSIFEEFFPGGGFQPHIRLTAKALGVDTEEQLMYQSDGFKQQVADRLLKLLMISRMHKIPLRVIECLKWDLGLPQDYVQSVIPEFPDYFRVVGGYDRVLELVCWSNEMAVSVMEKKLASGKMGSVKGKELMFPVQFSSGFEMDNKYEKWLKEWHKLPYVSPYENAAHLSATSDESDRWVVGVLHEILHILVPKKTEKDNVLMLGEWLGLRSRFKRALLQHPGIFYLSSKIGTYTVVLREGYKRGSLIEHHPLMNLRSQYIHLMNTVKEDSKTSKVVQGKCSPKSNGIQIEGRVGEGEDNENNVEEHKGERCESSDSEAEDASETDVDDGKEQYQRGTRKTAASGRGRDFGKVNFNVNKPLRDSPRERSAGKLRHETRKKNPLEGSSRIKMRGGHKDVESAQQMSRSPRNKGRSLTTKKTPV
ncbi:protein WHAT'S THIS FACTOR 9, mitochondrial [Gastrolobium bilobum]|uniref:protein WHAT'S THIS FACTOR 9, mitochondrial n=1 Tax=Gastrolobium bilobum TaxID=150636 RepID=UPI002AAF8298|nr:protein WHAT'S THIS FACTOR 9, mitochondrial [Gastrolobium bilobum]